MENKTLSSLTPQRFKKAIQAQARIHANKDDRDQLMIAVKTNEVAMAKQVLLRNGFTAEDLENAKITLRTGGGKGGEDELEISATCCDPKEITIQRSLDTSQNSCYRNRANHRFSIAFPLISIRIFRWNRFSTVKLEFLNQEIRNPFSRKRTFGFSHVLKHARFPPALAATLAVLPSISEIPFLD